MSEHTRLVDQLFALLDEPERVVARRFHFLADQERYVVAHGVLRLLLGEYTRRAPASIRFDRGPFGKPALRAESGASSLEFNLSHSGDLVAIAFSCDSAVGVDVEAVVDIPDTESLAEHVFSPAERATLRRVAPAARMRAFFDCWARKEAYIKATGVGLSDGLDYFDVSLAPGEAAALLTDRRPGARVDWALHDIAPPAGHAGALVCAKALVTPVRLVLSASLAHGLVDRTRESLANTGGMSHSHVDTFTAAALSSS